MHLLPTLSFLLIITSIILVQKIPKSFCQDQQFVTCGEAYRCGNIDFTYPFWGGGSRPNSCGYPGFEVSCQGNIPRITVSPVAYRVLASPNTDAHTLTVARDDLWNELCPTLLHNTTLDFRTFSSSNIINYTLSYGCTIPPDVQPPPSVFNCVVNDTSSSSYFASSSIPNPSPSEIVTCTETRGYRACNSSNSVSTLYVTCNSSIIVPINQANIQSVVNETGLRAALNAGFSLQYEANNTNCNECNRSGGRCGYNTDSNSFICYCTDRAYDRVCNGTQTGNGENEGFQRWNWKPLVIGLSGGAVFISSLALIYCLNKRNSFWDWEAVIYCKSDKGNNKLVEEFMSNYGAIAPKLYSYSEIKRITNSFADELGRGGYGCVYRGKLSDGREVAVKVLSNKKGNGEDFINEVASFSRTSHVNVVTLLGFCYNMNKRALIFEFMPNGSLDKFIHKKGSSPNGQLEWKLLYEIVVGTARGLEYLHRGCNTRIVHFDIKPHNILLDKDFCPKITDFGLAKLCERKESIISMSGARGTCGYIAPEVFCRNLGGVSHKSDVYSYGMMVLEMVGLRRKLEIDSEQTSENYFPNWIYEHLELGKELPLEGVTNEEQEEIARKMIFVGLWCIQTNPADRPSISKVVEMLEGSLSESLQIPKNPFVDSAVATKSIQETWTTTSSIS